jgi:hypothetical protein
VVRLNTWKALHEAVLFLFTLLSISRYGHLDLSSDFPFFILVIYSTTNGSCGYSKRIPVLILA